MSNELALPILNAEASPKDILEALAENLGGRFNVWDLDKVKIPAGGILTWNVPTLENPDGEARKELVGVPVFWKNSRVYYSRAMGETENAQPDCKSNDGKIGVGNPGGECARCPLSQWINDERPACKLQAEVFLLTEEQLMPLILVLSPASLKPWRDYLKAIGMRGIPYYGAITRFSLTKDKNPSGIAYSKLAVSYVASVNPEQRARLKEFRNALEPVIMQAPVNDVYADVWRGENKPHIELPSEDSHPPKANGNKLSKEKAADLHRTLGGFKLKADQQLALASAIAERPITSLDELTVEEAKAVWAAGKNIADGYATYADYVKA